MIKATHNRFYDAFFGLYLHVHMRLVFRSIEIKGDFIDRGGPVLLIGNHFSWWDGFIARHVNNTILRRKLHLMMDEEQLARRRFLTRLGAFSIKKNSRDAVESLRYAAEIIQNPDNLLIVFPQGRFESLHKHPLNFEKGWFRILKDSPSHLKIVFMATLVDFFASPRPGLTIYLHDATAPSRQNTLSEDPGNDIGDKFPFKDATEIADAYNSFFFDAISRQNRSGIAHRLHQ